MHPLHDYIARQIAAHVRQHRVVVLYDPRRELEAFFVETGAPESGQLAVGDVHAAYHRYAGSFFAVRAAVEPLVAGHSPEPLVIYVPGVEHDPKGSVLLELEAGGFCYKPQLKRLARNVLREKYTEGVIDDFLSGDGVTYADLARLAERKTGSEPPSVLKVIFPQAKESEALVAAWLSTDAHDDDIQTKGARTELSKLLESRLGFSMDASAPLSKVRQALLRYVLVGEFRSDLGCTPPSTVSTVPEPSSKDQTAVVRDVALRLRNYHSDVYAELADAIQSDLQLDKAQLEASKLGAIDTFRFEERALLRHCGQLIADGKYEDALRIVAEREHSYWLDRDLGRKSQWNAARLLAQLGAISRDVGDSLDRSPSDTAALLDGYASWGANPGWYRLDQAHRHLKAWLVSLDDDFEDEKAERLVCRAYEDACQRMTARFTAALRKSQWSVPAALHQTRVFSEVVEPRTKPVAYFVVDAMRFEMAVELAERFPAAAEVSLRPAIAALPSITPVGMAALLPAASASFDVVEQGGKLGARIESGFLPDLNARKKHFAARVPKSVDLSLEEVLTAPRSRLSKKVAGAPVIVVRSQEIDKVGEDGNAVLARQLMDLVIDNVARAIRRLAALQVANFVVTADHGHLFASDKDESMRIDPPGGACVELHRRCWVGRGGTTPPGTVRVSAAELGYHSDLELVFPENTGVFKAGGDLAYHHGGTSLQEMVIPVLTLRMSASVSVAPPANVVSVVQVPEVVASRTLSVKLANLSTMTLRVRVVLAFGAREAGKAGFLFSDKADTLDAKTGVLTIVPGSQPAIGFLLAAEDATSVKVLVFDEATDKLLCESAEIPVRLGM